MNNDSKARFSDPDLWIRLLYMIVFAVLTWLSRLVLCVIGLLQFLLVLVTGEEHRALRDFSASLAAWTWRAFRFICFNTEQKPFPFDEWPEPDAAPTIVSASAQGDSVTATAVQTATREVEGELAERETTIVEVEIGDIESLDEKPAADPQQEGALGEDTDPRPQP